MTKEESEAWFKDNNILYDHEDLELLAKHKWHILKDHRKNRTDYVRTNIKIKPGKYKGITMHRMLVNTEKGLTIDHINGNGLDNRKENLRIATNSQNCINQKRRKNNTTSNYKGVSWRKSKKKFVAQITFNGKTKHLGYFECQNEAAKAYNIAAKTLFGDFAYLNDIDELYKNFKARLASECTLNVFIEQEK